MPGSSAHRKRDNSCAQRGGSSPMSSFEWNKIIASILTAMIIAMASGILSAQLVRPKPLEKAVYLPAGNEQAATTASPLGATATPDPTEPLLANTDPITHVQHHKIIVPINSIH